MPKSIVITGNRRLDRKLAALGNPKLANGIARKALRAAAKPLAAAARANASKDSGAMRAAIKVRAGSRSRRFISIKVAIVAADLAKRNPRLAGRAGAFYPAAEEFGDARREPKAPMRRAFDAGSGAARDRILAEIRAGILAAAK